MMSWEDYCYACLIQNELERVQLNVREAKHEVIEIVDNRTANGEFKFGGF